MLLSRFVFFRPRDEEEEERKKGHARKDQDVIYLRDDFCVGLSGTVCSKFK